MTNKYINLRSSFALISIFLLNTTWAQETRSYTVERTSSSITIDGVLDETDWVNAVLTETFVDPESGSALVWQTQAKMLWDDNYLYIGVILQDDDVWSTLVNRDDPLWDEENMEIFCDPDGDEKNYFEMEFSPLGTIFDQLVDRSWIEGSNNEDNAWNMDGLLFASSVLGTINDPSDKDSAWFCEVAIPFEEFSDLISPLPSPPEDGDEWRLQLCRYNRERDNEGNELPTGPDLSAWNQIEAAHFHVPKKFGKIVFSNSNVSTNEYTINNKSSAPNIEIIGNYPNPFSYKSEIKYTVHEKGEIIIDVLNINGKHVKTLVQKETDIGTYSTCWQSENNAPGIYLLHIHNSKYSLFKKMLLIH